MCGIAGVHLKNPKFVKSHTGFETFINALFLGIESRGKRATGLVACGPEGKGTVFEKADMCASDFIQARNAIPEGTRTVLLHTRLDTQGDPKKNENNHPVISGSTFATHNGAIYNDAELFRKYQMERKAEVDSEAISALLNKEGLDKAQSVLEKLRGPLAIAAIDPIRYPDQLLLARGEWSPLYVHDGPNFMVWASSQMAIRDAWALVLGTPPNWNKFHSFKEGEFWLVADTTIQKGRFQHGEARAKRRSEKNDASTDNNGAACGVQTVQDASDGWDRHSNWGSDDWDSVARQADRHAKFTDEWTKRTDLKDLVEDLRACGKGKTRIMNETDPEELKGVGVPRWVRCQGCKSMVLWDDVTTSLAWGKMCDDCYACAISLKQATYENPANALNDKEKLNIHNWAQVESMIHRKALGEIAEQTELSEETIEWLIFRVPKTYLDKHKKFNDLAAALDDLYQDKTFNLFRTHGINQEKDPMEVEPEKKHPLSLAERTGYSRCEKHRTVYVTNVGCSRCKSGSPSAFDGSTDKLTCRACAAKSPPRVQRGRIRLGKFVWCNKHHTKCHECLQEGIDESKAVATTPDGTRLCHFCVRSVNGALFDGNLEDRGIKVDHIA